MDTIDNTELAMWHRKKEERKRDEQEKQITITLIQSKIEMLEQEIYDLVDILDGETIEHKRKQIHRLTEEISRFDITIFPKDYGAIQYLIGNMK
jgi:hypothetical protein